VRTIELASAIHDCIELFSALGMLSPSEYEDQYNTTGKPPDSRTTTPFYLG
jgi:hypothetical protein